MDRLLQMHVFLLTFLECFLSSSSVDQDPDLLSYTAPYLVALVAVVGLLAGWLAHLGSQEEHIQGDGGFKVHLKNS